VRRRLERLHRGKAAGVDGIGPRVLKTCAIQHLHNLSREEVPVLWKTSGLVSVLKKTSPYDLYNY